MAALLALALMSLAVGAGDRPGRQVQALGGRLASGAAAVEEYKKKNGVDAEYLDAVGWLARGRRDAQSA